MTTRNENRLPFDTASEAGIRYFASGSNHAGEIDGLARCGFDVGVAVHEMRTGAEDALCRAAAQHGTRVFVDSGAFSEVDFGAQGPYVAAPISDEEWAKRLAVYVRLAAAIGPKLFCVAPDMVAFQAETLDRLERWAHLVRAAARRGANILVPVQKGTLPMAAMWELECQILAVPAEQLIAAIPMKKDATTPAELAGFLAAARPARVHLLGIGPKSDKYDEVMNVCATVSPETVVYCDSVLITSMVGRTGGAGGAPRLLTVKQDEALEAVREALFVGDTAGLDWTDAAIEPSTWLTKAGQKRLAKELGLDRAEKRAFLADIDGWLQEDDRYEDPTIELALERLWAAFATTTGSTAWRKADAIERCFGVPAAPAPGQLELF